MGHGISFGVVSQSLGMFSEPDWTGWQDEDFEEELVAGETDEVKEAVCSAWDLSRAGTQLALKSGQIS